MINRIGLYSINGSVFTVQSTVTSISEDLTTNATGSVTNMYPSEEMWTQSGSEVLHYDAYWNGTSSIDDFAFENVYVKRSVANRKYSILKTDTYYTSISASGINVSGSTIFILSRSYEPVRGHSFQITSNRSDSDYAVMSFITGALADNIGTVSPSWFLNYGYDVFGSGTVLNSGTRPNFGTPFIPDSSMSLGNVSPDEIDAQASADLLRQTVNQTTLIPNANTLTDFLNREGYTKTTEQLWQDAINSGSK